MRRIFYSFLSSGLLLLGQTARAQNVSLELIPITYPIVLPDSGGSFDYILTVTNLEATPLTGTVWCTVTQPNGSPWGPVLGPATQTFAGGQTQSCYRTANVPPRAPYGYFIFHAYVGLHPDTIWAQDEFEFQHQAINGTEQEWVAIYDGPGNNNDGATSLAVGGGNVYVTGSSYDSVTDEDYATVKYDNSGNQVWVARYNGLGNFSDAATCLAVDGGNVYVTGWSWGSGTGRDYATVKYDAFGNQMWVARYNGPGNGWDEASSLALDGGGNVYVTGWSEGSGTYDDYATVKYDASGNQIWVAHYDGPLNGEDHANSMAVDGGGNVYVTGGSYSNVSQDYATVKYDVLGNQLWVARYNGPANFDDEAQSLAVDDGGNVYVTGKSTGWGTYDDYATIKYDCFGNWVWAARYNGPENWYDLPYSLALDGGGNVYVTGRSFGSGTGYDYTTIKYDASGNRLWVARYNGPAGNGWDQANSIAVDDNCNVYITGESARFLFSPYNYDYATVKYDASGNQLWVARYNGPGDNSDQANSLAVDGNGSVYVTGRSYSSATLSPSDYATIKYSGGNLDNWMPMEATVFGQPLPQEYRLEQNFPNPFNLQTTIRFDLPENARVELGIYDIQGREVATLVNGWREAGAQQITWEASSLPSGIYFCRIKAGDFTAARKVMLVK